MDVKQAFGIALRESRRRKGLTQEDFSIVSSRTHLSSLERGVKGVTLEKAVELAERIGVHPLSLLAETFLAAEPALDLERLLDRVRTELKERGANRD